MTDWIQGLIALGLFLLGLRCSAFFSGSETGFYRLSIPRLHIDSRTGDAPATRLLWFSRNPSYFVTTCLIGNNVANYLISAAVGSGAETLFGGSSDTLDLLSTLLMAPVIFQFGELLPKTIYYLVPYSFLRRESRWFQLAFYLFLPITWPIVQLIRQVERWNGTRESSPDVQMGRNQLLMLVQHGRSEGVLTDLQTRLANGLLQIAPQSVIHSMIPSSRVLGVSDLSSRKEMLEFARKYGVSAVAVYRGTDENAWYGYAFVAELLLTERELPLIHQMLPFPAETSKLEALHRLQVADASYGAVYRDGIVVGVVARNGLVEQIFRPSAVAMGRLFEAG